MSTQRVEIDLNDVDGDGLTTVLTEELSGAAIGDAVTAYQLEDSVEAPAVVVDVNPVYVSLRVEWAQMKRIAPAAVTATILVDRTVPMSSPVLAVRSAVALVGSEPVPSPL